MQPSNKAIYLLFFPVAEKCFILQVYNGRWPLAELFSADQNVARPNRTSVEQRPSAAARLQLRLSWKPLKARYQCQAHGR